MTTKRNHDNLVLRHIF